MTTAVGFSEFIPFVEWIVYVGLSNGKYIRSITCKVKSNQNRTPPHPVDGTAKLTLCSCGDAKKDNINDGQRTGQNNAATRDDSKLP